MLTLSASKIKTFIECPNRYYHQYIRGVPSPKNIHAILGTSFHKAIELYYKHGANPIQTYDLCWNKERTQFRVEHDNTAYYDGLDMIGMYPFGDRRPDELEKSFTLLFPNEQDPICKIRGFIDQIYFDAKMVWDLKTGKRPPTGKTLSNDPQFLIYAWAAEQIYGFHASAVWYHARTGEQIAADIHGDDKMNNLIGTINEIIAFHEDPKLSVTTKTCFFCPFPQQCRGT